MERIGSMAIKLEGSTMQVIDSKSQANTAWMEHEILNHVKQALRVTVGWKVPSEGIARKLSSVQFTLKSFQRHLERLMNIEEQDGYMLLVLESKPNLDIRLKRLEREHEQLRENIRVLVPAVEMLSETDDEEFERLCDEINSFLDCVDRHDREEIELLQEAMLFDEGGEG